MFNLRDVVVFLAGAEFFHMLSHILLGYMLPLPLDMKIVVLSPGLNMGAIAFNGLMTLLLLIIAAKMEKK